MQHVIKKQSIELVLDKRLDHFHIQQLISTHYWGHIVPLLEKLFDKMGNEDEIIDHQRLLSPNRPAGRKVRMIRITTKPMAVR